MFETDNSDERLFEFDSMTFSQRVSSAEIRLGLYQVQTTSSFRNIEVLSETVKKLDPHSAVLNNIQMGKTKANYLVTHGISKFVQRDLKRKMDLAVGVTLYHDSSSFHQNYAVTGTYIHYTRFIAVFSPK